MSTFQESPRLGLRVAQAVGITLSAYLFGQNAGLSYMTVPALMEASAPVAARQWEKVYDIGKAVAPPMAIISALATGYTAYCYDQKSLAFRLNALATLIIPTIVPFTLIVMAPTNNALREKRAQLATLSTRGVEKKDAEAGVAEAETVHALLDKWAGLNLARAMIAGVGSILAVCAALNKSEVVSVGEMALRSGADRLG